MLAHGHTCTSHVSGLVMHTATGDSVSTHATAPEHSIPREPLVSSASGSDVTLPAVAPDLADVPIFDSPGLHSPEPCPDVRAFGR